MEPGKFFVGAAIQALKQINGKGKGEGKGFDEKLKGKGRGRGSGKGKCRGEDNAEVGAVGQIKIVTAQEEFDVTKRVLPQPGGCRFTN